MKDSGATRGGAAIPGLKTLHELHDPDNASVGFPAAATSTRGRAPGGMLLQDGALDLTTAYGLLGRDSRAQLAAEIGFFANRTKSVNGRFRGGSVLPCAPG